MENYSYIFEKRCLQVCFGLHETILRFEENSYIRIEGEILIYCDDKWSIASKDDIVRRCLSTLRNISEIPDYMVLQFESGSVYCQVYGGDYREFAIVDPSGEIVTVK